MVRRSEAAVAQASYERCSEAPGFFETFYRKFLEACPEAAPMFADTDFERQNRLLRHAIVLLLAFPNQPRSEPTVLARLAVHENWHGHGLGRSLLREAVVRSLQVSANAAIKAIVVHALHERARGFYEGFGFQRSRLDEMTLMAPLKGLSTALGLQN